MERELRRRAKSEIVSLCHSGLGVAALFTETCGRLGTAVPYDRMCWHTVDPATLLFTSAVQENLGAEPRLPHYEYEVPDVNKWAYLARRPWPVGVLDHATHGHPEQSARYRDLLRPRGISDELRASFVADGRCWGYLGLYRDRGRPGFSEDEAAFVADIDAHVAAGVRRALLIDAVTGSSPDLDGPGVILLDTRGEPTDMNPAAECLISQLLDERGSRRQPIPHTVLAVAAQARRAARGVDVAPARSRAHTVTGVWLMLHGTQLGDGPDATTAVIIEPARPSELAELIILAYGLTLREREVTRQVLLGRSTAEIAWTLHLSAFTVQDHLKAIFEKVGVRSRRELVATIFRDRYWPRVLAGDPVAADGWYKTQPAATQPAVSQAVATQLSAARACMPSIRGRVRCVRPAGGRRGGLPAPSGSRRRRTSAPRPWRGDRRSSGRAPG